MPRSPLARCRRRATDVGLPATDLPGTGLAGTNLPGVGLLDVDRPGVDLLEVDLLDREAHATVADTALARRLARAGVAGVVLSTGAIGALHLVPPSRSMDPLSSTISEYALLSDGWIFDVAVVLLAIASLLVLLAMVIRGMVGPWSPGALMITVWSIGLVGLVVFPKQAFGADSSFAGRIHWTWTLVAFFSLPIGSSLVCWSHRHPDARWPGRVLRLSTISGAWFLVLTGQTVVSAATPIQAWRVVGLVERALSVTEMAVVVVLALWVLQECRSPAAPLGAAMAVRQHAGPAISPPRAHGVRTAADGASR